MRLHSSYPTWSRTVLSAAAAGTLLLACSTASAQVPPQAGDYGEPLEDYLAFCEKTDVLNYDLKLDVNPVSTFISGSNEITVKSLVNGLTTFRLRLQDTYTITGVEVNGVARSWTRLDLATIEIALGQAYQANQQFVVKVSYQGIPQWRVDWFNPDFREAPNAPGFAVVNMPWYVFTWIPVKEDLRDRMTVDLKLTVPSDLTTVSVGKLHSVVPAGAGKKRHRWQTQHPIIDTGIGIYAGNYNTWQEQLDYYGTNLSTQYYVLPEHDTQQNRDWMEVSTGALYDFKELFQTGYMFADEKFASVEIDSPWGTSSHSSVISWDINLWDAQIAVHEAAHQWWLYELTCSTWNDVWLQEASAQYSEALREQALHGDAAMHALMNSARTRPTDVSGQVYREGADIHSGWVVAYDYSTVYQKGAWVHHMLHHVLGDDDFLQTWRTVLSQYGVSNGGPGHFSTEDYRATAEAVSGRDLGWFFDQWVFDRGAPEYEYSWRPVVIDGTRYVELYINQIQSADYPVFTMPIDIVTTTASGQATSVVWNDARTEHFLFPVGSADVSAVQLDPTPWILRTGDTQVPFVEGPPKIASATPAPGAVVASAPAVEVVFHKDVVASAGQFTLVRDGAGPVAVTFAYDPVRHAVTLTPSSALAAGQYTLTVAGSLVDAAAGLQLDGEIDAQSPSLPSGDGLPGGAAQIQFTVQ